MSKLLCKYLDKLYFDVLLHINNLYGYRFMYMHTFIFIYNKST